MLLREMFSPLGAPKEDQDDVDWIGDLKFYIDNDDKMLEKYFFPAVDRHKKYVGNPNVFKLYVKPIENCLNHYCQKFNIDDRENKFPKEEIIKLAKLIADQQEKHIKSGDYETK